MYRSPSSSGSALRFETTAHHQRRPCVSRDVQTGTVAHEDRVRARGVRIPAEHDLLPRAGIEGNGTGVIDGPAKPAGRIAGEARSAVEYEGTIRSRGKIVINGTA